MGSALMAASATFDPRAVDAVVTVAVLVVPADGVRVLRDVFRALQGDFPGAIVIVPQAGTGYERSIADNLNVASNFMVLPGLEGTRLRNARGYVVSPNANLVIGADGRLTSAYGADAGDDALLLGGDRSAPTWGEALLASLASRYGGGAIGVALTGLDSLQREGFRQIRATGGHTIALDETDRLWADSSGARVMPDSEDELLSTAEIGPRMIAMSRSNPSLL